MSVIGYARRSDFYDNGFVILPGFFDELDLNAAQRAYDAVWTDLPVEVTVDTGAGRRIRACDATEDERRLPLKVNDVYLRDAGVRAAVMSPVLAAILGELLQDDPVICNTLSVERGTQQPDHLDTLYMTPQTPGKLVATWMAIDDVRADAGPLRYFPGSNHIEPFRFEDGSFHVVAGEMERWSDYMADEVDRHGLEETRFLARRGDLLIWDAWLLHGGSPIDDLELTRRSLITHYYAKSDCLAFGRVNPMPGGGNWLDRAPQFPTDSFVTDSDEAPVPPSLPDDLELRDRLALLATTDH